MTTSWVGPVASLTPREQEILAFLTEGRSTAEIAARLYVSQSTVKAHLTSIFRKLGVSNRTEAAIVGLGILARPVSS